MLCYTTEKLRQYFEAFGAVQDAVVMKDPVSRRSRGFGFITFEHTSFVDNALQQHHTIDSRKVHYITPHDTSLDMASVYFDMFTDYSC